MPRCGNCHKNHDTSEDVRKCYFPSKTTTDDGANAAPPFVADAATTRQLEFIGRLLIEKDTDALPADELFHEPLMDFLDKKPINKREASDLISALLKCPASGITVTDKWSEIPEGKYALVSKEGPVVFYSVNRPTTGRWAGQTWVALVTGGPGEWRYFSLGRKGSDPILERISEDPIGAARLFGDKTATCGRCSSPLSNVQSRAAGYGQTCAAYRSWPYPSRSEAMKMLRERKLSVLTEDEAAELERRAAEENTTPEWTI